MTQKNVGLMGARSLVGERLIPLLLERGYTVHATTRRSLPASSEVAWHKSGDRLPPVAIWVSMMPIWELPAYFRHLEEAGIKQLIAFSSTSRLVKADSPDAAERQLAAQLAHAEEAIARWAQKKNIEWVILRPTMIYDEGKDKNISAIARFITRFGFFPIVGSGKGLRMPVYASDLAEAIIKIAENGTIRQHYYNLSGKDSLTYNDMVLRIFESLGKKPRIVHLPHQLLACGIAVARILPRLRHLTPGIALRMQKDQAFSHNDAVNDFAYNPRAFRPVFR